MFEVGDVVDLIGSDNKPYTQGNIIKRRKVRGEKNTKAFGEYEYYITGNGFGTWSYEYLLRAASI